MKKKINVKITATNKPSDKALINFTKIIAQLYWAGKISIDLNKENLFIQNDTILTGV